MVLVVEIFGWIGAILLILAYFLITHHELDSKSKIYQGMNLFGSIFVGINAIFNRAYPSFIINLIWLFIGIYGFYKIFSTKKIKKK